LGSFAALLFEPALGKALYSVFRDTPILVNKAQCHPEEEAGAFPADDEWISWITGRGHINERHGMFARAEKWFLHPFRKGAIRCFDTEKTYHVWGWRASL